MVRMDEPMDGFSDKVPRESAAVVAVVARMGEDGGGGADGQGDGESAVEKTREFHGRWTVSKT